jgi:hypothetical protein
MFRVEWLQEAVDELANIWVNADTSLRHRIAIAAHTLESRIADRSLSA